MNLNQKKLRLLLLIGLLMPSLSMANSYGGGTFYLENDSPYAFNVATIDTHCASDVTYSDNSLAAKTTVLGSGKTIALNFNYSAACAEEGGVRHHMLNSH
ncbi:hypothetical protein [Facilibium subflavum]|uniref:hypothetical protein n=1 Tax=Facilibium subflavum TaxID=2219058 RepID=UPI000E654662|nr:hypothetical protein [Facilibium subflavum]